jgi:hypothetical protein
VAEDVSVRQILAEWARIGRTTIVNGEKLTGPTVTLQLVDRPEREVLEVLLRSAAGYLASQRSVGLAAGSVFDRIMILPTSRPPAFSGVSAPPAFNRAMPQPQPQPDEDDPVEPVPLAPPQGPPGSNIPNQPPQPGQQPAQPLTSPRPGMLPQTPGVQPPNPFGTPGVRPGGPGGPGGEKTN